MEDNTTENSFNEDFCNHLEYQLSDAFKFSKRTDLKGFWCDGVSWNLMPGNQISNIRANEIRKIETKAWIGKDGQDEYKMSIHFGKKSFNRLIAGKDLVDTIPSEMTKDWYDIDPDKRTIEIRLK